MSGDLEDFLRRAAQRRQAKAAQQKPQPASPPRPQYSNRRTERVVQAIEAEELLTAELVEDAPNSFAARQRRLEESKKAAAEAEAAAAKSMQKVKRSRGKSQHAAVPLSGIAAQDLARLLAHPAGLRQAILLREILDRPEHRW